MKYYAVRKGKNTGIFTTWDECNSNVTGFSGAEYKSFKTLNDAEIYMSVCKECKEKPVQQLQQLQQFQPSTKKELQELPVNSFFVDGGCNSNTEGNAWGSVVFSNGSDLLCNYLPLLTDMRVEYKQLASECRYVIIVSFTDVTSQQNNGAELLAMIAGLRIANYCYENNHPITHIFSDSQLIINYWSKQLKSNSNLSELKQQYILECINLRKKYESYGGTLVKISGDINKADLGWHK